MSSYPIYYSLYFFSINLLGYNNNYYYYIIIVVVVVDHDDDDGFDYVVVLH